MLKSTNYSFEFGAITIIKFGYIYPCIFNNFNSPVHPLDCSIAPMIEQEIMSVFRWLIDLALDQMKFEENIVILLVQLI
jgi:hypothetical protein